MIDQRSEQQPPDDDGQDPQARSADSARDDYFTRVEFGYIPSASRIVNQIELNLTSPEKLAQLVDAELARIDLFTNERELHQERETLLYAFKWAFSNLLESGNYSSTNLLAIAEQSARVFERFSDRALLGAPAECELFFSKQIEVLDCLYDQVRMEPSIQPRYSELLKCIGRGIGSGSTLGNSSLHSDLSGPFDRMQIEISEFIYTRLADAANFDCYRPFPAGFSAHEIRLITALVELGNQVRECDLRELYHFLFVKTYEWYLKNSPEVVEFGGQPLPESEVASSTMSYQDSDSDDRDAPWRESLKDDDDHEVTAEESNADEEPEHTDDLLEDDGLDFMPPDKRECQFLLDHLFLNVLEGFRVTLSPHTAEKLSQNSRDCLLALVEDLEPEWFAWTPVLSVYASISAESLKEARIPLQEKLVYGFLQGNSHLAENLIEFVEGGRDQLELLAAVLRDLKRPQQQLIIEAMSEAGSAIEWEILGDSEEPDRLFSPTVELLVEALKRPSGQYLA